MMAMSGRAWSEEEDACLRRHYRRRGAAWVARRLGRSTRAVQLRAIRLGASRDRARSWTAEEIEFLRRNVRHLTHREIARALGRGADAVNTMACKLGLHSGRRVAWTHREVAALRDLYGTMPNAELARRHFPGRDGEAVREKARRLGLARTHFRATPEALAELRRLAEAGRNDEEIAEALGTNDVTARKYRRQMGLPHNGRSDAWRAKIKRAARAQLREAGVGSLAELRWLARRVEEARKKPIQDREQLHG